MEDHSDEQLASDYLKGKKDALEILIKRYLKPIYGFSLRFSRNPKDAEDITQEVFIKVWRNLRKFKSKKGSFKNWIFTIAKNTYLDFLKKKKPTLPLSGVIGNIPDISALPDELSLEKDDLLLIKKWLGMIPPKYRLVLSLRYDNHLTFREISEMTGESIDTVKTRYRRGLAILKKLGAQK